MDTDNSDKANVSVSFSFIFICKVMKHVRTTDFSTDIEVSGHGSWAVTVIVA